MDLRDCLASQEREDFVTYYRRQGCTLIAERQKNRYVDEFLRYYADEHNGDTDPRHVTQADLVKYAKFLERKNRNVMTARIKLRIAFQWLRWLAEHDRIAGDPTVGLNVNHLVHKGKKVDEGRPIRK